MSGPIYGQRFGPGKSKQKCINSSVSVKTTLIKLQIIMYEKMEG